MARRRRDRPLPPTRLVADANVLIAAFLRDSTVRRILALADLQILVPDDVFDEIEEHFPELLKRTGMREDVARELLQTIAAYVMPVPGELVRARLREASRAMSTIDPDDAVYVATALALPCDGIWSDDPHLKQQDLVPCWTTRELLRELRQTGFVIRD
ncbi:MAG: PIN domain-containing protein [Methanobacteriota archaeon]